MCNTIPNCKCQCCNNLVLTTAVTRTTDNVTLTIPAGTYANGRELCICIAQTIPTAADNSIVPVVIQIGTDATTYPLLNRNSYLVYSDQIRSRRIYCTKVIADTEFGAFSYNGVCKLPCSKFVLPASLPLPTTPATPTNAEIEPAMLLNTKSTKGGTK